MGTEQKQGDEVGAPPGVDASTWKSILPTLAGSAVVLMKFLGLLRGLGAEAVSREAEDDLLRAVEFEEKEARADVRQARSDAVAAAATRESAKGATAAYERMRERAEQQHAENLAQMDARMREETAGRIFVAFLTSGIQPTERLVNSVRLADELRAELARTAKKASTS